MTLEVWTAPSRVGFVSTRIAGLDGVSLEVDKWARIIERHGCQCFYLAGELDRAPDRCFLIEEAHFKHRRITGIHDEVFGRRRRSRELSDRIHRISRRLKKRLYEAIETLELDLIIAENCLTIPLNIPLGIALVEVVIETGIPCIAHHHDFVWERERFRVHAADDFLEMAFPPRVASIDHVVINSLAQEEFTRRLGLSCALIPNIMDFARPPGDGNGIDRELRADMGLTEDDILILQPTRVIERKGIEHTIELVRRLEDHRCRLVLAYDGHDEGDGYVKRVRDYATLLGVEAIFGHPWIGAHRGERPDGGRCYLPWDAFRAADLVAYPSTIEGFGNAFLEAIYFRKPLFCNRYPVFRTDIEPHGFQLALMDGYLTPEVVDEVRRLLHDEPHRERATAHNYRVARSAFSYEAVEQEIRALVFRRRPGA